MELYSFTSKSLRIKSDHEVKLLPGFHRIVERNEDGDLIHSFDLISEINSEKINSTFYSWYEIENYQMCKDNSIVMQRNYDDLTDAVLELAEIIGG